jgi:hypothetical protein
MKSFRQKSGPFKERPYYTLNDIENTCTQELQALGLLPSEPGPIRIDRFIEKRFGISPQYEDLPDGVLGYSRFGSRGVEAIIVARSLAEDESRAAERRVTTTMAHEAGHALLHAHLFALGAPQRGLFGGEVQSPKILCRTESVPALATPGKRYDGRWWEFQANQAIGALLLPRGLVERALAGIMRTEGALGLGRLLPVEKREDAAVLLASIFNVNPAVGRIRLQEIYPMNGEQLTL